MTEIPPVEDLARRFASSLPASVEMPAGCGKTELIAATAAHLVESGESLLILTHTHAGVDALKRRMLKFGINANSVIVRTLDSWAFDLVRHFPLLAETEVLESPDWTKSKDYHRAAARAIPSKAITRMIRASYAATLVDEYQDCDVSQHSFVKALRDIIPVGVLGDSLQSIFHFKDNQPVDWETEVTPTFPALELPFLPRRWAKTNPELGRWLIDLRAIFRSGSVVQLSGAPVTYQYRSDYSTVTSTCLRVADKEGSIAVLGHMRNDCVAVAANLGGRYAVMEALDEKVVSKVADDIDSGQCATAVASLLQFAIQSSSKIPDSFPKSHRDALTSGRPFTTRTPGRRALYNAFREFRDMPTAANAGSVLLEIEKLPSVKIHCREAWRELKLALSSAAADDELTVSGALNSGRNSARAVGRPQYRRVVSRPRLAKGLEYDHVIILNPERYSAQELYVALTRGSQSVTIIHDEPSISKRPMAGVNRGFVT